MPRLQSRPRTLRPPYPHNAPTQINVAPRAFPLPLPTYHPATLTFPRIWFPRPQHRPLSRTTHHPRILLPHRGRRCLPRRRRSNLPPLVPCPSLPKPHRRSLRSRKYLPSVSRPHDLFPPRPRNSPKRSSPQHTSLLGQRPWKQSHYNTNRAPRIRWIGI